MRLDGNTVFITGGGSGIGRALAEAFHRRGSQVIVAGRRRATLDDVVAANPGVRAVELDVQDPASIRRVAGQLVTEHPGLNVLINNAGIMQVDDVAGAVDEDLLTATITTNLMGPIRLTAALLPHLRAQARAAVINTTSGLAFTPLASAAIYSATKAALHSYTLSLRYKLRGTSVKVIELAPPWVQTDLLNSKDEPRAMPLADFSREAVELLGTDVEEVLVERVKPLRNNAGPAEGEFVTRFNDMLAGAH